MLSRGAFHLHSRRAIVLFTTIALLAVLAMIGTVFALLARMERNVSAAAVDRLRARTLASAGVEMAIARLRETTGLDTVEDLRKPPYRWGHLRRTATPDAPAVAWPLRDAFGITVSGELAATYDGGADVYSLTVTDCASRFPLDARHPFLARMLDTLGAAIAAGRADGLDPVRGRGAAIVALRDSFGGFRSRGELRLLLSEREFEALAPYVGLYSWVDATTASAVAGREADPQPELVREPRSPIDLNSAPVPVLCSILAGVDSVVSAPVPFDTALRVAREIARVREGTRPGEGPLEDWAAVRKLLESLSAPPTAWLAPEQAEALLANLDPNLTLGRLNPERVIRRPIDKTRLTFHTLDGCFRSMGRYEIESTGRILRSDGQVVAEARTVAVAEVYGVLRETLQSEFEAGRTTTSANGTTTFPEPPLVPPSAWSGHVQLRPGTPSPVATPTFLATFDDSFEPRIGQPPLSAPSSGDVLGLGRVHPDGASVRTSDDVVLSYAASPHISAGEGTLEAWVKLDEAASVMPQVIWFSSLPVIRGVVVEHRVSLGAWRDTLTVQSVRSFADDGTAGVPCPYRSARTEVIARVQGAGVPNEWHHLAIAWRDGTDQRVYVDGRPIGAAVPGRPSHGLGVEAEGPGLDAFWVGGMPVAYGGNDADHHGEGTRWMAIPSRDFTVDDLAIYPSGTMREPRGFVPPDRFVRAEETACGIFEGTFPALPFAARFETVTWTEWDPSEYEGRPLARGSVEVKFGLWQPGQGGPPPGRARKGMGRKEIEAIGLPMVLVAQDEIRYRLEFVTPAMLTPMNVTPVVDDIEITYQGPVRFLAWQED